VPEIEGVDEGAGGDFLESTIAPDEDRAPSVLDECLSRSSSREVEAGDSDAKMRRTGKPCRDSRGEAVRWYYVEADSGHCHTITSAEVGIARANRFDGSHLTRNIEVVSVGAQARVNHRTRGAGERTGHVKHDRDTIERRVQLLRRMKSGCAKREFELPSEN
jgi:hypothetical protein